MTPPAQLRATNLRCSRDQWMLLQADICRYLIVYKIGIPADPDAVLRGFGAWNGKNWQCYKRLWTFLVIDYSFQLVRKTGTSCGFVQKGMSFDSLISGLRVFWG